MRAGDGRKAGSTAPKLLAACQILQLYPPLTHLLKCEAGRQLGADMPFRAISLAQHDSIGVAVDEFPGRKHQHRSGDSGNRGLRIDLAGRLTVERKAAYGTGSASLYFLLHAGMCDHEPALVEPVSRV